MSRKRPVVIGGLALLAVASVAYGLVRWMDDGEVDVVGGTDPTAAANGVDAVSGRRPNDCPTNAPLVYGVVQGHQGFTATHGIVSFQFPGEVVDRDTRLRAQLDSRFGGLVLKAGIQVALQGSGAGSIRGQAAGGEQAPRFSYPGGIPASSDSDVYRQVAPFAFGRLQGPAGSFVPGAMLFPEPGCYQVFVTVEGVEYGPFGFEIAV